MSSKKKSGVRSESYEGQTMDPNHPGPAADSQIVPASVADSASADPAILQKELPRRRTITCASPPTSTTSDSMRPLILTSVIIIAVGACLTVSPLANTLGLVPLPPRYWLFLAIMLLGYAILTQAAKTWFMRRFGDG